MVYVSVLDTASCKRHSLNILYYFKNLKMVMKEWMEMNYDKKVMSIVSNIDDKNRNKNIIMVAKYARMVIKFRWLVICLESTKIRLYF